MTHLWMKEYRTVTRIAGPLIFVDRIRDVAYGEIVAITGPRGATRYGQVLEVDQQLGVVQVFSGNGGLDVKRTRVHFTGGVVSTAPSANEGGSGRGSLSRPEFPPLTVSIR